MNSIIFWLLATAAYLKVIGIVLVLLASYIKFRKRLYLMWRATRFCWSAFKTLGLEGNDE